MDGSLPLLSWVWKLFSLGGEIYIAVVCISSGGGNDGNGCFFLHMCVFVIVRAEGSSSIAEGILLQQLHQATTSICLFPPADPEEGKHEVQSLILL